MVLLQTSMGTAMEQYAGINVSLESSSVCVVDGPGRVVREAKVASEPEAFVVWFRDLGLDLTRIGLEAGPLSRWQTVGLRMLVLRLSYWKPVTCGRRSGRCR